MALYDIDNRTRAFGAVRRWQGQNGVWYSDTHKGDDYAETYGNDSVLAVHDAKVIDNRYSSTYGWLLWTRSLSNPDLVIKYHMLDEQSDRAIGSTVSAGKSQIGRTGASAANASGNHVHIQAELNGVPVDPRPYIVGGAIGSIPSSGGSTPIPIPRPTPNTPDEHDEQQEEDDEMAKTTGIFYTRADKVTVYALINPVSGFYTEWSGVDGTYNNPLAIAFETGSFAKVTESHAKNLKASCAEVRKGE